MTVLFHAERIRPAAPQHGRQRLDCDPLDLVQGNSVSGAVVKLGGTLCAFTVALSRPFRDFLAYYVKHPMLKHWAIFRSPFRDKCKAQNGLTSFRVSIGLWLRSAVRKHIHAW